MPLKGRRAETGRDPGCVGQGACVEQVPSGCNSGQVTNSRFGAAWEMIGALAGKAKSWSPWAAATHLSPDEAEAIDLLTTAHESHTYLTAASSGVEQATLESLLAKGGVRSTDGVRFALTSDDLEA